jgi:hypothetical protein
MLQNLVRILPEILALRRGMPVRGHSRHKPLATVLGFRLISKRRKYARTCRKMETPSPSHLSIICWKPLYAVLAAQSHSYRICPAKECADNICYSTVPGKERGSSELITPSRATSFSLYPNLLYTRRFAIPGRLSRLREGNLFLELLR